MVDDQEQPFRVNALLRTFIPCLGEYFPQYPRGLIELQFVTWVNAAEVEDAKLQAPPQSRWKSS